MRTINQTLEHFETAYPLERIASPDRLLFIDIETTGFTAKNSSLYLIGAAYFAGGLWHIRQWFADSDGDEAALLKDFFSFAADYTHLIHFNGNHFDLPYLLQKCEMTISRVSICTSASRPTSFSFTCPTASRRRWKNF